MLTGFIQAKGLNGYYYQKSGLTGHVQVKNGKWFMVLNFVNEEGKPRPKWMATKLPERNNKNRAKEMLKAELERFNSAELSYTGLSMPELVRLWLEDRKHEVRPNSYVSYRDVANVHIIPYFEKLNVAVQDLEPVHIRKYYTDKLGQGLSCLDKHRTVIRSSLEYAIHILNILKVNPSAGVEIKRVKGKNGKRLPNYYSVEEINALFESIKGESIETPVRLAATCGLCRSEALGLQWSAVDFKRNTITIFHTAIRAGTDVKYEDTVKEDARFRSMPMPKSLRRYLKKLYQHQRRMKELFGAKYHDNDYICKWDDGKPLAPDYVTQRFRMFLKQKGLRHLTFHQLRHSSASLLITNGHSLEEVQAWLGHASRRSTEIYAHYQCQTKMGMANTVDELLTTA